MFKFISNIRRRRYFIGFLDVEDVYLPIAKRWSRIKWLNEGNYKAGWFADPFFLSVSDSCIELLVEEWIYEKNRGRLSHLQISHKKGEYYLEKVTPILELDTHLSFPNIWKENGKVYVYPENSESGMLNIYEYDEHNKKLINPICIINQPLVDTSIFKDGDTYYAFGTKATHDTFDRRRVFVYSSNNLFHGWSEIQVITNEFNIERGAGAIVRWHDRWIRPVQNCEGEYGEDTIFYELHKSTYGFSEEYVSRLEPMHNLYRGITLHTFNVMDRMCVIDGNDFCHPFIARKLKEVKRFFKPI